MAAKKTAKKKVVVDESGFVTKEQFSHLENAVGSLVDLIRSGALGTPAAVAAPLVESPAEKKIKEADPKVPHTNPEWEAMAREIIGEAVDHTELAYVKGGGQIFTVVIKAELSNAPKDYLERYKVDRRSKEISAEGEGGVKTWCEQIRNNLNRPRQISS